MKYYETNKEAITEEKERLGKATAEHGVNFPIMYCLPGSTMVRILPAFNETGKWFKQVYKHRVPTIGRATIVACPKSMAQLPCPICDKGKELMASLDEDKMKFARDNLKPRQQFLYNIICVAGPANRDGQQPDPNVVQLLEVGVMTHQQIVGLDQDEATGWANIADPNAGVTLSIGRTGQGLDTKYVVNPTGAGRTSIFEELMGRGIDVNELVLFNLEEVYTFLSDEQLKLIVDDIPEPGPKDATGRPTFKPAPSGTPPASPAPEPTKPPYQPSPAAPAPQPTTTPVPVPQPVDSGTAPAQPADPSTDEPVIPKPPVIC
jgi:hypothetical protein